MLAKQVTLDEFESFVAAHHDRTFEYIGGEIVEVPSNPYVSSIAVRIAALITLYLMDNDTGHVTGEAGGFMVGAERYAPDVAFTSYARAPELAKQGYNPVPPDLAVEVISDPANAAEGRYLRRKLTGYLAAGVTLWVVDPENQIVEVHAPDAPAHILDASGTLTAEAILPGFALPVSDIFPAPPHP